jgi:hypothetical protein
VEDLLDHFGGIDGDLLKWVCCYGDGGLVKNLAGAEIFFLPKGGRLAEVGRARELSRVPAVLLSGSAISPRPIARNKRRLVRGSVKDRWNWESQLFRVLYCGCEGEKNAWAAGRKEG